MKAVLVLILLNIWPAITLLAQSKTTAIDKNAEFIKIETSYGNMYFQLADETPVHKAMFIKKVKAGYYDDYDFNRVIKGFVIQGGKTDSAYAAMTKDAGEEITYLEPEFSKNLFHRKGALAAGRDDNKEKKSFDGQFYVVDGKKYNDEQLTTIAKRIGDDFHFSAEARKVYGETGGLPNLDQNYTVFGQLIYGFDVLEKIASVKKNKADQPLNKINIKASQISPKEFKKILKSRSF